MLRTIEPVIESDGSVHLLESVELSCVRRALVTVLDALAEEANETVLLSEPALAREEEDGAWQHLQAAGRTPARRASARQGGCRP